MLQQWLSNSDASATGSDSIATVVRLHGSEFACFQQQTVVTPVCVKR
jgi:hypothetical protein